MEHMPDRGEPFVLEPGPLRLIVLTVTLVGCAGVFVFLAGTVVTLEADSLLGRFGLILAALVLVAFAVGCLLFLRINAVRIQVGSERFTLRMPRMRGPLPMLSSIKAEVPLRDVASVESRAEIFTSFGMVTEQRAYSVVTRDGVRLPLGTMVENWDAPLQLRFDQAAARIAERAGMSIVDRGAVHVGGNLRAMIRGLPPWETGAMTAPESADWHQRAITTVQVIAALGLAVALLRACIRS